MEHQNTINFLNNATNQLSKFRTKKWVEINDNARETSNTNSEIKFKNSMLKSSLCDYSDAHIIVSGTITVVRAEANAADIAANKNNKQGIFKSCSPLTECITEINNSQIGNAKDLDVVKPMYNLTEYINSYSKTSGRLYQF